MSGNPPRTQNSDSPLQTQRVIAQILKNHLEHGLDERDKAALTKASIQLISHASTGLWIGSLGGTALAFRSRYRSAFNASKAAGAGAYGQTVSKALFYPGAVVGGTESSATKNGRNVRFLLKGLSYGLLGGFVGTQVGVITGTLAGRKTIQTEGTEERIAFAIRKVSAEMYERGLIGDDKSVTSALTGTTNDQILDHAPSESFYTNQMVQDIGTDTPTTSPNSSNSLAPTRSDANTKWDELRKANSAKSSWDAIRESSSQSSSSSTSPPVKVRLSGELPQDMSSNAGDMPFEPTDKEQQRIEFEKLMARERLGNDTTEGRWR